MTYADRWLLPDGIEEILPAEAGAIEQLRRRLVDLYASWGYDLVIPPLLEYTDSLLIGLGRDVDLLTFKVTDQLTGRTLGIRADITPQTARMDAHSFNRQGTNRLCYAGHVVHTRPKNPLGTRTPIQAGVEFYGEPDTRADIEVVSLLLESLKLAGLPKLQQALATAPITQVEQPTREMALVAYRYLTLSTTVLQNGQAGEQAAAYAKLAEISNNMLRSAALQFGQNVPVGQQIVVELQSERWAAARRATLPGLCRSTRPPFGAASRRRSYRLCQ